MKNVSNRNQAKKQPGPSDRFKSQNSIIDGNNELSKKAKRRMRQKLRKQQMNGIAKEDIANDVDTLKIMKRLDAKGDTNELQTMLQNGNACNGKF